MRIMRGLVATVIGLVIGCGAVLHTTPVSAGASTGLSAQVGLPGVTWEDTLKVGPSTLINVEITYTNVNHFNQKSVIISDMMPAGALFSSGSAYLDTSSATTPVKQADTLTTTGIGTGVMKSGDTAHIQFEMTMPPATSLACGDNALKNQATGKSLSGNKSYATSNTVTVQRACSSTPPTTTTPTTTTTNTTPTPTNSTTTTSSNPSQQPVYGCGDGFTFYKSKTRTVRIKSFNWVASHGAFYNGADMNWGDGSAKQSAMDPTGVSHAYAQDGQYTVSATLHFTVNGSAAKRKCSEKIHVQLKPTTTTTSTDTDDTDTTIILIGPVYIDDSVNTTDVTNGTEDTTAVAEVDSDSAATPDTQAADDTSADTSSDDLADTDTSADDSTQTDAKSLVNTGAGNIFGLFIAATVVGTIGSRLILYRLLKA